MPALKDILKNIEILSFDGTLEAAISSLDFDSRNVSDGSLFFAVPGTKVDGHSYIENAVEKGATAIVCERYPVQMQSSVTYVKVADAAYALGVASSNCYGVPSKKLKLIGVTGTNGKTTVATLLYDLFRLLGYKAGLISTVVNCINDKRLESTHTTPDPVTLNKLLAEMVETGCDYCFMEVSSHSIVQNRISGLEFAGGIFTNITHDHLDYHGTFAEYIKAKKLFFDKLPKEAFAVINTDDRNGGVMVQNTSAGVKTVSLRKSADFKCRILETHFDGMLLSIGSEEVWVNFLGKFNAYNLLSVYATAISLGADKIEVLKALSELKPVNGRFEYLRSGDDITAIVDYAHTPDALQNVIDTINEIRQPGQKLTVIVGCGGNRDAAKRPVMAKIAVSGSDLAILTTDNPRNENPELIISDMKSGLNAGSRYIGVIDRREAIRTAYLMSSRGDIILVAGKGHETYQEICGIKTHFDDKEEIRKAFNDIKK